MPNDDTSANLAEALPPIADPVQVEAVVAPPTSTNDNSARSAATKSDEDMPKLTVGGQDDRGNTVKYIYSLDPNYVIYYSRLEHRSSGPDGNPRDRGASRRWLMRVGSFVGLVDNDYEREGVQAQLSANQQTRAKQLKNLLPLGTDRAKLRALLSGWPRRESYDSSIATALQLALDGDGDGEAVRQALATLNDAKQGIASEREVAGRAQWATFAVFFGVVGFFLLGLARHNVFPHIGYFWLGTQAGVLGAMFSIAWGISKRTVAPSTNARGNLTDSVLRLLIGAISGGTVVLLFQTGLVPTLHTATGDVDATKSMQFVVLLGILAGFVERLVPGLLDSESDRIAGKGGTPPATPAAPAAPARPGA